MKVLYAFQGTGNGHHTRAVELLPLLRRMADVDVWVSGGGMNRSFDVDVDRRFHGVGFTFGTKGGIDWGASIRALKPVQWVRDVRSLDLGDYDVVLNDFEPVTAWAARRQGVPVVGLSHQAAVKHPSSPKPAQPDRVAMRILNNYAPAVFTKDEVLLSKTRSQRERERGNGFPVFSGRRLANVSYP